MSAYQDLRRVMTPEQARLLLPPCAETFDPIVSDYSSLGTGWTPLVGSVLGTVSGEKAWQKWGSGSRQWAPLHPVSMSFGANVTVWDSDVLVPSLACDSLGGFKAIFRGTVNQTTDLGLRVNKTSTGMYTAGSHQWPGDAAASPPFVASGSGKLADSMLAGATGGFCFVLECDMYSSTAAEQSLRISCTYKGSNSGLYHNLGCIFVQRSPNVEILNLGLVSSASGALDATCTFTLYR
jgi:hypothetical protein